LDAVFGVRRPDVAFDDARLRATVQSDAGRRTPTFRQENCRQTTAWIVIALKRNGAYALDIQVATTWIEASCLKVESIITRKIVKVKIRYG
jgi:hypothetical protein